MLLPLISLALRHASVYRARELLPRARALAQTADEKADIEYQLARMQVMSGQYAEARRTLRRAAELGGHARISASLLRDSGDWASLERDPEVIGIRLGHEVKLDLRVEMKLNELFERGMAATRRKKYEEALVTFEECTRYAAWYAPCWRMLRESSALRPWRCRCAVRSAPATAWSGRWCWRWLVAGHPARRCALPWPQARRR